MYTSQRFAENNDLTDLHADALEQLGDIQMSLGGYSLAKEHFEQNRWRLVKELSDNLRESSLLNNMALVHLTVFRVRTGSSRTIQKSVQIANDVGNKRGQSEILENIGGIYFKQGRYPEALQYYERSLLISQDRGQEKCKQISLRDLCMSRTSLEQTDRAIECLNQSLYITKEIGDKKLKGILCSLRRNV